MEDRELLYAKKLQKLIQVKTVSDYGLKDLTKFYEFHQVLKATFPNIFATCEIEDFAGSLLIRWKGLTSDHPIILLNHFDVVEGSGEWKYPPFSGEIADGKIWGRGTIDTKGGLFCMLQACEELIATGFTPKHDIYFESACTEECDGVGADTISKELQKRGIKFDFSLDEGGLITHDPIGGADGDFAMIAVGEKNCINIKFTAKSNGGHASAPTKNTPLIRLSKFMVEVENSKAFVKKLNSVTKEMFKIASTKMKGVSKLLLGHPTFFTPILKAVLPNLSANAGAMLKTTTAFTMINGSDAYNSLPTEASVICNMRESHHQGEKKSVEAIKKIADKYDITTEIVDDSVFSDISEFKCEEYNNICDAIKKVYDGVIPAPYISNTASDSRYMTRVSNKRYGFVPFFVSDEQLASIHGIDENIDISCLPKAVDFYKMILEK